MRPDLIHRPGEGLRVGKAGVMPCPKAFRSLLPPRPYSFVRPATGIPSSRPELARAPRAGAVKAGLLATAGGGAALTVPSTALGSSVDERRSIGQHPVHDYDQLAGERHFGLFHAGALGELHGPTLQSRAALDRPRQHHVGGLITRRAHPLVADLGDAAGDVGLAGLILLRRHPEMRP